jgi:hypothetical protein
MKTLHDEFEKMRKQLDVEHRGLSKEHALTLKLLFFSGAAAYTYCMSEAIVEDDPTETLLNMLSLKAEVRRFLKEIKSDAIKEGWYEEPK